MAAAAGGHMGGPNGMGGPPMGLMHGGPMGSVPEDEPLPGGPGGMPPPMMEQPKGERWGASRGSGAGGERRCGVEGGRRGLWGWGWDGGEVR